MTEPRNPTTEDEWSPLSIGRLVAVLVGILVLGILIVAFILLLIGRTAFEYNDPMTGLSFDVEDFEGSDCAATQGGVTPPPIGADLHNCYLFRFNLAQAQLVGARLGDADLADVDLTGADLTEADLSSANLTNANLTGADLTGADLYQANFTRANLTGANLSVSYLTGVTWSNTTCPDGTNSDTHDNTCVGYGI